MARNNRLNPNAPARGATENLVQVLDTYVRPARDVMGEQAMAQGFNSLSQTVGNYSRRELGRELQDVQRQAQTDALAGNDPMEEFRQVRMGNIFRPHSRAYMDAYNATMGRVAAIDFRDSTAIAYAESGLDRNTDPEAYRTWYNERLQTFLSENRDNSFFMAGALPMVEQTTFNMSAQHTSNIIRTMQANRAAAARRLSAEATMNVMGEWSRLEEQRVQYAESHPEWSADIAAQQSDLLAMAIGGVASDFYDTGDAGAPFRGATLEGALDFAEATGNRGLISSISRAAGSMRLTPGELLDVTNRAQRIDADLITAAQNRDFWAERQRDEARTRITDVVADIAMDPRSAGMTPSQLISQNPELQALIAESGDTAGMLEAVRDAWDTASSVSNEVPESIALENEVDIREAAAAGAFSNQREALEWMRNATAEGRVFSPENRQLLMELGREAGDPNSPIGDSVFQGYVRTASQQAVAQLVGADIPFDDAGNTSDLYGQQIQNSVRAYMMDRARSLNPDSPTYAQDLQNLSEQAIAAAGAAFGNMFPDRMNERASALNEMDPAIVQNYAAFESFRAAAAEAQADLQASANRGVEILLGRDGEETGGTETPSTEPAPEEAPEPTRNTGSSNRRIEREQRPDTEERPTITAEDVMVTLEETLSVLEQVSAAGGVIDPQDVADLLNQIQRVSGGTAPSELLRRVNALRNR